MTERATPSHSEVGRAPQGIDPTKNVLDLVNAAIERVDDLRDAQERIWDAKFQGMRREIDTAERLRIEQKADTRTAVDAALAAAKEGVTVQALNSAEYARQQTATFTAALDGLTTLLTDLKERVSKIENVKLGTETHRTDQRASIGTIVGVAGAGFGLVMMILAVIAYGMTR